MPFLTQENQRPSINELPLAPIKVPEEPKVEKASTFELTKAAFRQNNLATSAVNYLVTGGVVEEKEDYTYDGVTPLLKTKYEPYLERFYQADSDADVQMIKSRIDQEEADRNLLQTGGVEAVALQLAAGILDPVNFIPVAGWLAKGSAAVKAATGASATMKALGMYGLQSAAVGAGVASVSEAGLQMTQEIRPLEESLMTIGGATVLSGILGPAVASLGRGKTSKLAQSLSDDLSNLDINTAPKLELPEGGSVGAAFNPEKKLNLGDESIVGSVASGIAKPLKRLNPNLNLSQSDSIVARDLGQRLSENAFLLEKNLSGEATSVAVETRVKMYDANVGLSTEELNKGFKSYKKRIKTQLPDDGIEPQSALSYRNFKQEVSLALTNGDNHTIPEVASAARAYRKYVYEPILKAGQTEGIEIFPKNLEPRNAKGYFPQMWDQGRVGAYVTELKAKIRQYLPAAIEEDLKRAEKFVNERERLLPSFEKGDQSIKQMRQSILKEVDNNKVTKLKMKETPVDSKRYKALEAKLAASESKIKAMRLNRSNAKKDFQPLKDEVLKLEDILDDFRIKDLRLNEGDYDAIVDEIVGHIRGQKEGVVLGGKIPLTKGPLKQRRLDFVPQTELRNWSITDADEVAKRYSRSVTPEIELRREFGGDVDMKLELAALNENYDQLIAKAETPKERLRLEKARKNDIKDVEALVGRLRGTYGKATDADAIITKGLQSLRTLAPLTKLGGIVLSSVPDLARLVGIKGLTPIFSEGIIPMIANFKGYKLAAREAKLAGSAWEVTLGNNRSLIMSEMFDPANAGTRFKKGLDAIGDKFAKFSLSSYYEASKKNFSSVLIQRKNLEDIDSLIKGTLDKAGIADLAKNGIGLEQAQRIHQQFNKYGKIEGGLYLANTHLWKNNDAKIAYRAALNKQISHFATQPGIADRPRWMSSELGKTLGMFESFNLAATSKILISSLQTPDMKTISSLVSGVGLGMMVYAYREIEAGRELSDNPSDWIAKGIDNSGLFGVLASLNNRISNLTGNALNASRLIGASNDEYRIDPYRKAAEAQGPAIGYLADAFTIGKAFNDNSNWTYQDTRAIRRLIPFQNLIYLRQTFDKMEEGINDAFGIKNRSKKK